jgi:hypothetical protein
MAVSKMRHALAHATPGTPAQLQIRRDTRAETVESGLTVILGDKNVILPPPAESPAQPSRPAPTPDPE